MKKLWLITFLTLSLLLLALPVYAATEGELVSDDAGAFYDAEEDSLTIEYGTETVKCENAAIKSGDVTYLPLREVLAAYGASVSWAVGEAEDKVIVTAGQDRYQLVVDLDKCEAYGTDNKKYILKHKSDIPRSLTPTQISEHVGTQNYREDADIRKIYEKTRYSRNGSDDADAKKMKELIKAKK